VILDTALAFRIVLTYAVARDASDGIVDTDLSKGCANNHD